MAFKARLKLYYQLTKPGIVYGNLVTAVAGFLLAAKGNLDWVLFIAAMAGISLVIASACVFNNYLDRGIDKHMARTKKRALVTGRIDSRAALIYAGTLGALGFLLLAVYVNALVTVLAAVASIFYVLIYGFVKRRSVHGALVGTVPGAAPPVMGYCAVTNHLDSGAVILFLILVFWQMAHFYGIALYRLEEYKAAKVPIMPLRAGVESTKKQTLLYILAFIGAVIALWAYGYAGRVYLITVGAAGIYWLWLGFKDAAIAPAKEWGRKMFLFSLAVNLIFAVMISLNWLLDKV